jgi:hypothetical protein
MRLLASSMGIRWRVSILLERDFLHSVGFRGKNLVDATSLSKSRGFKASPPKAAEFQRKKFTAMATADTCGIEGTTLWDRGHTYGIDGTSMGNTTGIEGSNENVWHRGLHY